MTQSSLTRRLAFLISSSKPSKDVHAMFVARNGVLDFLASAFPGINDSGAMKLWKVVGNEAISKNVTIFGKESRTDAMTAALMNGYIGHALDYDDVHSGMGGHPSTVILPALFALAEERQSSARDLLEAYIVGVETAGKVGKAVGNLHYHLGFHSTATIGSIGAAAATAYLIKLDEHAIGHAIGIAATQANGLRFQFGSQVKPLHAGLAARAGLFATLLAESGLSGSENVLDGPISFFTAYSGGAANPDLVVKDWGSPWQIIEPGLQFKQYPCCFATHTAADIILQWKAENKFTADQIYSVTITFPPDGDAALVTYDPKTGYDGRFSIEYVAAVALIEGRLSVDAFTEEAIRPDIATLARRVKREYDLTAQSVSINKDARFTKVEVKTKNGEVFVRKATYPEGTQDIRGKFLDAVKNTQYLTHVPELVGTMESSYDLKKLIETFRTVY